MADEYVSGDESYHSCLPRSDAVIIISMLFLLYVMIFQQLQLCFEDSFLIWKLFTHLGPLLVNLYTRLLRAEISDLPHLCVFIITCILSVDNH